MKRNIISYGKQFIAANDSKHVLNSLKNEIISNGPYVEKFEKKLSNFLNSKYTLVCNSGTSALHLAFLTLGVKKDDVVIMPSINFIASFSICTSLGAKIYRLSPFAYLTSEINVERFGSYSIEATLPVEFVFLLKSITRNLRFTPPP